MIRLYQTSLVVKTSSGENKTKTKTGPCKTKTKTECWQDQDRDQDRSFQDQDQCWQDQDRDHDQKNYFTSLTITIITVQYIPEKEVMPILQKEI